MQYLIIETSDVGHLTEAVNEMLFADWECLGGMVISHNRYYQTMILYELSDFHEEENIEEIGKTEIGTKKNKGSAKIIELKTRIKPSQ